MSGLDNMPISFPELFGGIEFNPNPIAIPIGHGVYWYGIILAIGMILGLLFCMKQAPKYGLKEDNVLDMVLYAIPCCILGARLYYVLFNLDLYRDANGALQFGKMIALWDGGLAIYGAVIVGFFVAFLYTRKHGIPFGAMTDDAVMGLLIGQSIGRWANLINREAFGCETVLPWRMRLYISATETIDVHPTFLYESIWNLIGLLLIYFAISRARRFDGENTCFYLMWYGMGRMLIEGLRSDSLYLFNVMIGDYHVRVSQALSLVIIILAVGILVYMVKVKQMDGSSLYVYGLAEMEQEENDSDVKNETVAENEEESQELTQEEKENDNS